MRKLALLSVIVGSAGALLLGALPSAFADNGPHVQGAGPIADSCAACHRAHTARAGGLLKTSSDAALCYTCHGTPGTGANSDVQNGVGYPGSGRTGPPGALRGGGFENARIDSSHPSGQRNTYYNPDGTIPVRSSGQAVNSTHSVDSSSQTAWGTGGISPTPDYGRAIQLRCALCHDPHGNRTYRILRSSGLPGPDVRVPDATTKVYTTGNYWRVEDEYAPGFLAKISEWCANCHTRYLAPSGSGRRDSGDAVYTFRHRANDTRQGTPNCIQCHVAHGSSASMGGRYSSQVDWPNGTPAGNDSRLLRIDSRGTCQMCHNR